MVSIPEEIKDVITSLHKTLKTFNKPSDRKSMCLFTNLFDVKKKTEKRRVGDSKYKCRAIKVGNSLWNNEKRKYHSKINNQIKINLYAWISLNPQVFQSPIYNDYIKVMFDDQIEPQLVPKLLLHMSV